jgi:hypothetical protein
MIEVLRSRVSGPLEPYARGFAAELARQAGLPKIMSTRARESAG